MLDNELIRLGSYAKVGMALEGANDFLTAKGSWLSGKHEPSLRYATLPELIISALRKVANIVQDCHNARRTLLFDQVTADLVVEVLDVLPLNTFGIVFLLFSFEGELNENLLKLLIHEVDAHLFKSVFLDSTFEMKREMQSN